MLLTGSDGTFVSDFNLLSLKMAKGQTFELDHEPMVALEDLEITFTGLILHTLPPQIEIDQIKGEYQPLG